MTKNVIWTAIGIASIALAVMVIPDLKRYIRISMM
jgi:hypothetical protein